jgi:hypothetical protein
MVGRFCVAVDGLLVFWTRQAGSGVAAYLGSLPMFPKQIFLGVYGGWKSLANSVEHGY